MADAQRTNREPENSQWCPTCGNGLLGCRCGYVSEQVECDSCGEGPVVWWSDYEEGYCLKCFSAVYEKTWAENERLREWADVAYNLINRIDPINAQDANDQAGLLTSFPKEPVRE